MSSYYQLPSDLGEVLRMARSLTSKQILLGEVNPVSLCSRLASEVEFLRMEVARLKGKPIPAHYCRLCEMPPHNCLCSHDS